MKPNKECMKDILLFISENTKIKVEDDDFHKIDLSFINVSYLLDKMAKEGKYSIEEIAYNLIQCKNYGLLDVNFDYQNNHIIQSSKSNILGITLMGVDFMNQD